MTDFLALSVLALLLAVIGLRREVRRLGRRLNSEIEGRREWMKSTNS